MTNRFLQLVSRFAALSLIAVFLVCCPAEAQAVSKKTTNTSGSQSVQEANKQIEQTQTEIKKTKEEIARNEQEVKTNLSSLRQIESDIAVSNKDVQALTAQLNTLKKNISTLESNIDGQEKELAKLRAEYLKAVKKMRVARKRSSMLAFIFSSKNFSEARRRMRYMSEFSEWKEKRSAKILGTVEELKANKEKLVQTQQDANVALKRQLAAQSKLEKQKSEQSVVVAKLQANGEALRSHLANKQAEANRLNARISQLIAEEQARAAEEKRKAEEKRLAEERRKKEAEEKRLAEERRAAEEKRAAEKRRLAEEKRKNEELTAQQTTKKEQPKQAEPKKTEPKKPDPVKLESTSDADSKDYASARKRPPRSQNASTTTTTTATAQAAAKGSSFESMKGSLPKPVAGSFRIISSFGRQEVAGMPDVVFDNPGIDAHVAKGASASAVYDGSVAGVYEIPGYQHAIIVKHGDYYTIYANVESPSVRTGDSVKQGQSLGRLGADSDEPSATLIHFEIWKNQTKLNPSSWIR